MHALLQELRGRCTVGVVGGSDLPKIKEQLGNKSMMTVLAFGVVSRLTVPDSRQ
jgi:hypothetical protein